MTARKLLGLPIGTGLRKLAKLSSQYLSNSGAQDWSSSFRDGYNSLLHQLSLELQNSDHHQEWQRYRELITAADKQPLNIYRTKALLDALRDDLNLDFADWDLASDGDMDEYKPIHPMVLYLDGLRSPYNIGATIRSALFFGISEIRLSEDCADPFHSRALRSARVQSYPLRVERMPRQGLGTFCQNRNLIPTVLELGGHPLAQISNHSKRLLIIGSEELGVHPETLAQVKEHGERCSIVGAGIKHSLNVSVACGIALAHFCNQ